MIEIKIIVFILMLFLCLLAGSIPAAHLFDRCSLLKAAGLLMREQRDEAEARLEAVRERVDRTSPEELPGEHGAYARGCNDVRKDVLAILATPIPGDTDTDTER